jgi:hypothetical protein
MLFSVQKSKPESMYLQLSYIVSEVNSNAFNYIYLQQPVYFGNNFEMLWSSKSEAAIGNFPFL